METTPTRRHYLGHLLGKGGDKVGPSSTVDLLNVESSSDQSPTDGASLKPGYVASKVCYIKIGYYRILILEKLSHFKIKYLF